MTERTFSIIKPDAVAAGNAGAILVAHREGGLPRSSPCACGT